jgi:hypothetical protein
MRRVDFVASLKSHQSGIFCVTTRVSQYQADVHSFMMIVAFSNAPYSCDAEFFQTRAGLLQQGERLLLLIASCATRYRVLMRIKPCTGRLLYLFPHKHIETINSKPASPKMNRLRRMLSQAVRGLPVQGTIPISSPARRSSTTVQHSTTPFPLSRDPINPYERRFTYRTEVE